MTDAIRQKIDDAKQKAAALPARVERPTRQSKTENEIQAESLEWLKSRSLR